MSYTVKHARVSIRSNIDVSNFDFDLSKFLDEIDCSSGNNNLHVYSGILVSDDNPNYTELKEDSFSKCFLDNHKKALKSKATSFTSRGFHLAPKDLYCGADLAGGFVFLPDGRIVNCWNDLASREAIEENCLGEIVEGDAQINISKLANWLDSTDISEISQDCRNCSLLPICLSGCPKARGTNTKDCCYPKYWLKEYIEAIASNYDKPCNEEREADFV